MPAKALPRLICVAVEVFMKSLRLSVAVCALAVFAQVSGWAQAVTGTVLGTVMDSSGAVVARTKVVITEVNTGVSRTSETNDSGNYTFPDLPGGTYSVSFEAWIPARVAAKYRRFG